MDAKARLLLKHLERLLKEGNVAKKAKQSRELERIAQYLRVLLTGCEAKLFSKACVRDLLEGVQWVSLELSRLSVSVVSLRPAVEQALKVARLYSLGDMEKSFNDLLPILFSISSVEDIPTSTTNTHEVNLVGGLVSPRTGSVWHRAYLKPLLRLLEYHQTSEKKIPFASLWQEVLPSFLAVLKDPKTVLDGDTQRAMTALISPTGLRGSAPSVSGEAKINLSLAPTSRLPLMLLNFFQEETLTKEGIQTLLSLTQSFAEECLKCQENDEAYALLDKAIILADQPNLATNKVALTLMQGKIFSGDSVTKTQREQLPFKKVEELLRRYFDALPVAEAAGNPEQCAKLYRAITVLEKQFLYQTMAPWVVFSMSQAVESGVKETLEEKWARFQGLSKSLLACELPELAWDCLCQCQSALTGGLKELHAPVFEALVEVSSHVTDPARVQSNASSSATPVVGEWQQARQQLVTYRKILERGVKDPQQFSESQRAYTENMQGLVIRFFREAEVWLGTPPEPYAVLGLGSISRKTMSPYSDFECVFLVNDGASADWEGHSNPSAEYFDALYQLFEFKMASLGELHGFRLDEEGHPRKESRVRDTPTQVIQLCKQQTITHGADGMTYSLMQSCFIHGDEALWKEYQTQFLEALREPLRKNDATMWGVLMLKGFAKVKGFVELHTGQPEEVKVGINVKKQYVSPLFYLLTDVALHHQWFFTDPATVLKKWVDLMQLPSVFAAAYRQAIQIADRIRVRLHLHYKEQQDVALLPGQVDNSRGTPPLIALTQEEHLQLQCIEWGVLQPMQQALLRWQAGYEDALRNPIQALLELTLLKSQQASDNRPVFSVIQREAMRSVVAMLWLSRANPEEYRFQYLRLPNAAIRQLFLEKLDDFKAHYEISAWHDIQRYLEDAPYRDGSRDAERVALAAFESQLACLVVPGNKAGPGLEWIDTNGTRQSGNLHLEVVQALQSGKLLDSKGKFQLLEKHVNLPGRHLVFPLDLRIGQQSVAIHIKFFPEMPGMEYAAGCLARLLVGWGAPYVQLARLVDGNKAYPVLLSQTIAGDLLSDVLKQSDANEFQKKLDRRRYGQRLLLSLLLNQEDAKPSNFIAVADSASAGNTQYGLFCIDNDRSFFQAVAEENGQIVPIVKDMTYCFETMHEPLLPLVCVDALFIEPLRLLQRWLETLETFNRQVAQLFRDDEVEKLFPKKNPNLKLLTAKEAVKESILPIVLREQVSADLFVKMVRIQHYLRKYPQATGYELLRHVEPYLSKYYGNLLRYYPQIDARFQQGFARLYSEKKDKRGTQQTLKTAFATLQTFHGKPVDSQTFLERRKVSIKEALTELSCAFDRQHTWESVYEKLQKGLPEGLSDFARLPDHYLRSKIVNQLDFSTLSSEFEKAFWDVVLPLKIPFQKLVLKHSRIESVQFNALLQAMPELRLLHLEDCQKLGDNFIGLVAQYCPILAKLWLSQLPFSVIDNRQSFIRQLFTPEGAKASGVFEELRYLSIRQCDALSEVYVRAPALTHVEVQACPQFLKGSLNSASLREVKLSNAPLLTQTALSRWVQEASKLKVFEVSGCPLLKALPFYQRFPYLLPLDVTVFSERWVGRFVQALEPYEPKKLSDGQVTALVTALKSYVLFRERFKNGLLDSLKEASMDVNVSALLTLGQLGYWDESIAALLQTQLKNANPRLRQAAAITRLCLQGEGESSEMMGLVESALSSPDKSLAQAALRVLMGVSGRAEKLATELAQTLASVGSDTKKTQTILWALSEIRIAIPAVIVRITPLLLEKDLLMQAQALLVLGRMGVLDDAFAQNASYFQALGRDSLRFAGILADLLRWDRGIARQFQARMLPLCKPLPVSALPTALLKQAKDTRWEQRKQAMAVLRDLQVDSKEIRGILIEAARDLSHQVRQLAIEALASLPHPDPFTVAAFTQALQDKERLVCEAGMQGFGSHPEVFNVETFAVMQPLILNDSATSTRKIFAQTLSQLSQRFPQAFEQLLDLMQTDKYTEVKQAVMEGLLTWLSFNNLGFYLEEVSLVKLDVAAKAPRAMEATATRATLPTTLTVSASSNPSNSSNSSNASSTAVFHKNANPTLLMGNMSSGSGDIAPSVLFPKNFRYVEVLRRFRQTLWESVMAANSMTQEAVLTRLLAEATTPLLKAVLLEAFEWVPLKLSTEQSALEQVRLKLTLAERVSRLEKKPKLNEPLSQSLFTDLQLFLQQQLADVTDVEIRRQLQEASDRVRILRTIFSPAHLVAWQKDETLAFKQLTVRHLVEVTGQAPFDGSLALIQGAKKVRAKKIWESLGQFLKDYLPVAALQGRETELATRYQALKQRYQQLLMGFKAQLQLGSTSRWKPQWLYGKSVAPDRSGGKKGVAITSFFHVNQVLSSERWVGFDGLSSAVSSLLGSTYFGAEKSQVKEMTLCMDANYQQGHTGATSDGYGHFADPALNRSIQQAAYRTVKLATRYADLYLRPEDLFGDLPYLFQHLGQAVKHSSLHPEESGTASCVLTKVFPHASDPTQCTVVAAGVGDGMVLAWDPKSQQLRVLVKPRQYDRGSQFTPVSITESVKGDMLQCAMISLPAGAFVMRLTDGGWQALSCIPSGPLLDTSNQKRYLEYTLNTAALMPELTLFTTQYPQANAKAYREFFMQWIQKSVTQKKAFLLQETHTIRGKIDRFTQKSTAKVADFLQWVAQTDPNYSKTLAKFFEELHVDMQTVKDAPLTDFVRQLDKIHLGDDVAIHVEQVGEQVAVTQGLGLRV
jgi:hypothetical protein